MNYSYRGKIFIHAGKGIDKDALESVKEYNLEYPQSKILAEVEIVDCLKIDDNFNKFINDMNSPVYGNKQRTGYAWKLKNIKKLNCNNTINGKQGIWYIDDKEIKQMINVHNHLFLCSNLNLQYLHHPKHYLHTFH